MFILKLAMELDDAIKGSYACRDFLSKEVPLSTVWEIINSATRAQSAANMQNWFFLVVRDDSKKEEIAIASLKQTWMSKAPLYLVFCNNTEKVERLFPKRGRLYSTQAMAVAAQNAILKIHELSLASCWIGAFDEKAVQRILSLPETVIPEIILVVGHPGSKKLKPHLRTDLERFTYFDTYENTQVIPEEFNLHDSMSKTKKKIDASMKDTMGKLKDFLKKK